MATSKARLQAQTWTRDHFLISTDPSLFPVETLADIFESKDFYWAKSLPPQAMREMLENSLSFGLYDQQLIPADSGSKEPASGKAKLVGLARCITDFATFSYLTDVWVEPVYQGKGLGSWLVGCVQEVVEGMPHLRRSLLFTADWERSVPFYEKLMGMTLIESRKGEGLAIMEAKGRGHPSYGRQGTGYD